MKLGNQKYFKQQVEDPSQDQIESLIKLYYSGQVAKAELTCFTLLKNYPQSLSVLNIFAALLAQQGKLVEAVKTFNKIIQIKPDYAEAHSNRGNVLAELGRLEEAVASYDRAIQLKSDYAEAYSNRGNALAELGRLEEAIANYDQAIQLKSDYAEAYTNRGNTLVDLEQIEEAVADHSRAIALKPDFAEAYSNRSNALTNLGRLEEAIADCNQAIRLKPNYAKGYYCRGVTLKEMGKFNAAITDYKRAIEIEPDYVEARSNLSILLLLSGDLKNGWCEYEYGKLSKKKDKRQITPLSYPLWAGQRLEDKVILVQAEQGVGDEIMFASCIPDLINLKPKKIVLECDSRLAPLFQRSFPEVVILYRGDSQAKFQLQNTADIDFRVAAGDLPRFFRQDLTDFPCTNSFLIPNTKLRKKWENRYKNLGEGMKVGLSWTGGANGSKKRLTAPTLEQLLPLLSLNAYFINLQYGDYTEELKKLEVFSGIHIYDWKDADSMHNLENHAAQIAELDLVITFDNATAQMAGGIGKQTWVLVSSPPFWMYMLERSDSPWYPSITLFRQVEDKGWEAIISTLEEDLSMEIDAFRGSKK